MFAPCGVAAGMIARCDENWPVWSAAEGDDAILRPGLRPAWSVQNADRARLMNAGINLLQAVRIAPKFQSSPRTLASGSAAVSDWRYLSARRLALFVMTTVERGTRWMLFERNAQATWTMARAQVEAFLDSLYSEGAFAGRSGEESYFVVCDERINNEENARRQDQSRVRIRGQQAGRISRVPRHTPAERSRTRPITLNRFANYSPSVDQEIESRYCAGSCRSRRSCRAGTVSESMPVAAAPRAHCG